MEMIVFKSIAGYLKIGFYIFFIRYFINKLICYILYNHSKVLTDRNI